MSPKFFGIKVDIKDFNFYSMGHSRKHALSYVQHIILYFYTN